MSEASYYVQIDGRKLDRRLWEIGQGGLTLRRLAALLARVADSGKYTAIERETLDKIARGPGTPGAIATLRTFLRAYHPDDWAPVPATTPERAPAPTRKPPTRRGRGVQTAIPGT